MVANGNFVIQYDNGRKDTGLAIENAFPVGTKVCQYNQPSPRHGIVTSWNQDSENYGVTMFDHSEEMIHGNDLILSDEEFPNKAPFTKDDLLYEKNKK